MKSLTLISVTVLTATSGLVFATMPPASALMWNWSYSGAGIEASGTLTTGNTPDNSGFYLINGITGTRNGEIITGLQPKGTAISGNEPFAVDNLISLNPQQLTANGFGYSTGAGDYANPFRADFLPHPGYLEFFSAPPFIPGAEDLEPQDSELPVSFSATPVSVTEPSSTLGFLALGTFGVGSLLNRNKKRPQSIEKQKVAGS